MKKIILLVLMFMLFFILSCSRLPEEIREEIKKLEEKEITLKLKVSDLHKGKDIIMDDIEIAKELYEEMKHIIDRKKVKYVLNLELKQTHFSLDIEKHLKDQMNAVEFEIFVDKDTYNNISVGNMLLDEFRKGSAILYGSVGNLEIKVIGKRKILLEEKNEESL